MNIQQAYNVRRPEKAKQKLDRCREFQLLYMCCLIKATTTGSPTNGLLTNRLWQMVHKQRVHEEKNACLNRSWIDAKNFREIGLIKIILA